MDLTFNPGSERCPLCDGISIRAFDAKSHDSELGEEGCVSVVECTHCEFAWQWPLSRSYSESLDYFSNIYTDPVKSGRRYYQSNTKSEIAALQFEFIDTFARPPGSLLDVGSGDGSFVVEADKYGWRSIGIEPSAGAGLVDTAPTNGAPTIIRGTLDDLPKERVFDVITMWDVIEHVEEPMELIAQAQLRLKIGGYLIIETGNFKSADRIIADTKWFSYKLDHRWYFAPDTIEKMLRRMNFDAFIHAQRTFRPWNSGRSPYLAPSGLVYLRRMIRRPWRVHSELRTYIALRRAAALWPQWAGLPIFTVAARLGDGVN